MWYKQLYLLNMKIFFAFVVSVLLFNQLRAQHCPYDGAGLLVVAVRGDDSSFFKQQDILISLRDVSGNIIYRSGSPYVFVVNPKETLPARETYDHEKIAYSFAADNFIVVIPANLAEMYKDKGGIYVYANPVNGKFDAAVRRIYTNDIYDLHYINSYVPFGSSRREPVPQNDKNPFHHLVRMVVYKQLPHE